MKTRFTFGRIAAFALVAGLAVGGATASYTLSRANFDGSGGDTTSETYARHSGNGDATGVPPRSASRCPGCRDSYDMVYLNDPRRTRSNVRVGRGDPIGGLVPEERDYVESPHLPPPETGWGDKQPVERDTPRPRLVAAPSPEEIARDQRSAASDERMARAARQIARTVVQTATMNDPVTIHRPVKPSSSAPAPSPTPAPPPAPAAPPAPQPRPGG